MAVLDKISALVSNQFPSFYKEDGANFLAFMEAYYEYMEQEGKLTDAIRNMSSYHDINTTTDEYLEYFRKTLLPSIPADVVGDKRLMAKYIKEFNTSRGTFASYKLLFRALYNEEVELNYPADQILKVSDGDWRIDRYLVSSYNPEIYSFIGKTIKGADSSSEALVEDIVRRTIRGRDIVQILLSNIKGIFSHLEPITLKSDTENTGFSPIVEAGISSIDIISPGGEYVPGDIVDLISEKTGDFAKIVVTGIVDLGGSLTYSLVDGGSGYTAQQDTSGTIVNFTGGDGTVAGSFALKPQDISDTFAISQCITLISSNTVYGSSAPTISGAQISTFADMPLASPSLGFPEPAEIVNSQDFFNHEEAVLTLNNTSVINVGDSLFGVTSSANCYVNSVVDNTLGATVVKVDGYKEFAALETVNAVTVGGSSVGTVTSFAANAIGKHVLSFGHIATEPYVVGDEVRGATSGSFGVIKKIKSVQANGYTLGIGGADDRDLVTVLVSANTSSNLSSQFTTGPIKGFIENEPLHKVGTATAVLGTVNLSTSNATHESVYTSIRDSIVFEVGTFGTIVSLSDITAGSGYSVAPNIQVINPDIVSLGIGESYLTLHSDDPLWNTANSQITKLDTNDRLFQASSGASGDVKGGLGSAIVSSVLYANGTSEMVVRVWQDFNQRRPDNISFANNSPVTLNIFDSSYIPGEDDLRSTVGTGTATIVGIQDEGVLGDNAKITAGVGANGTITGLRVVDSGFSYVDGETLRIEASDRPLATGGEIKIGLSGVSNAEGYYATSRSHVSTKRGYIQDSKYYQEYSYEIVSAISLDRYRDVAMKLTHPAGQALYGKYQLASNADINVTTTSENFVRMKSAGTVSINNGSFTVTGIGTEFLTNYANDDNIIIEHDHKQFYSIPLNIVSTDTSATVKLAWADPNLTSANAYYVIGTI